MKISFSIVDIRCDMRVQQTIKECDLVFITNRNSPVGSRCAEDRDWIQDNISQNKCVAIHAALDCSAAIVDYITRRAKGHSATDITNYTGGASMELNTIYQSLPKGVPLTLYSWESTIGHRAPKIITIPHEN